MEEGSYIKWLLRGILYALASAFMATLFLVVAYKWVNPNATWLMVHRYYFDSKTALITPQQNWVSINEISPNLILAVIAAEDNLFMEHNGFDFEAIKKAKNDNSKGKRVRGASTITMQTAKNVFLWPKRSWVRKGFEAVFTVLIETFWGKQRIMEVYLNFAEFGKGIYGVDSASQLFFKVNSKKITRSQAALMAAVLPNPLVRNMVKPSAYITSYQQRILRNMNNVGDEAIKKLFVVTGSKKKS
jgi:monofunctional biosynthetic peptidoglycan transglycosylase